MQIGDTETFAIESGISKAYERLSFRALGYFALHVGGRRYGVVAPDATMLACSFDAVERRIKNRGSQSCSFASEDAGRIADAVRRAVYVSGQDDAYFGMKGKDFCDLLYKHELVWAPDGDEAFDDGSSVLQFDVGDRVRVIAFQNWVDGLPALESVRDVWLGAEEFYGLLRAWRDAFVREWERLPKIEEE